ncbi:hypothetical protein HS088_TW13G00618 [Tripterygium wilfordii]|uniref:Uncharacterized protein n=1 Tax=Tripterygium wilfordii TaxID=458696 RepID=A0A7J7CUU5_TRIWF|nr:hypothetical protein HS088_TW13G00618 [Tripterygium wilfordii]
MHQEKGTGCCLPESGFRSIIINSRYKFLSLAQSFNDEEETLTFERSFGMNLTLQDLLDLPDPFSNLATLTFFRVFTAPSFWYLLLIQNFLSISEKPTVGSPHLEDKLHQPEYAIAPTTLLQWFLQQENFNCDTGPAAKIMIKGVTTTGEKTVCKNSRVFKMLTQNLSPLGYFSIVFHLAGPVDPQPCQGDGANGMLQCIVKKK